MADPPLPDDDETLDTPETRFLCALWDRLDQAAEAATDIRVFERLDEILRLCEEAAQIVRLGPHQGSYDPCPRRPPDR